VSRLIQAEGVGSGAAERTAEQQNLVDAEWTAVELDHVHGFHGVVGILLGSGLAKAEPLMGLRHAVLW